MKSFVLPWGNSPTRSLGLLIVDVSRSHTFRLFCTSDQLVAEAATYTTHDKQETNSHALSGIQTRDSRHRAAAELRLRPQGLRNQLCCTAQLARSIAYIVAVEDTLVMFMMQVLTSVKMCLDTAPAIQQQDKAVRYVILKYMWQFLKVHQFYSQLPVCRQNRKQDCRIVKCDRLKCRSSHCLFRTAQLCDVTPCNLVTVVQAADRIRGTTRVHSSAVADQSNCSPGHDTM